MAFKSKGKFESDKMEVLVSAITCGICSKDSGPPIVSCTEGHVTCIQCFKIGMRMCPTKVIDVTSGMPLDCGAALYEITDPIKKTPYYEYFTEVARYQCSMRVFGCEAVFPEATLTKHVKEECNYRMLRYCQLGCPSTHESLEENLDHLIKEHEFPVRDIPETRLLVRYDRKEFLKSTGYVGVVPLLRAIIWAERKESTCVLMGEDMENGFTRIWLVKPYSPSDNTRTVAKMLLHSPMLTEEEFDTTAKEEMQVDVIPEIKNMFTTIGAGENGCVYYADLNNDELDERYKHEVDGKKYFGLLVKVIAVRASRATVGSSASEEQKPTCPSGSDDTVIDLAVIRNLQAKLAELEEEHDQTEQRMALGDDDWLLLRKLNKLKGQISKVSHQIGMCKLGCPVDDSDSSDEEDDS